MALSQARTKGRETGEEVGGIQMRSGDDAVRPAGGLGSLLVGGHLVGGGARDDAVEQLAPLVGLEVGRRGGAAGRGVDGGDGDGERVHG
jgi:hypothetical protein